MNRYLRVSLILLLVALLGGCYEIKQEVIPADQGVAVPYQYNYAQMDEGGRMDFTKSTFNNDYRFQWARKDGSQKTGTFRAIWIKDDVYAFQARYDDEEEYSVVFYRVNANRFDPVDPAQGTDLKGLAGRYGVTLELDDMADDNNSWIVTGAPSDVLAFLRAHKDVEFVHSGG